MRYPLGGTYPWAPPDAGYLASRSAPALRAHPAPEVPCRSASDDEIPTGARRVATRARRCGFACEVTYARGTTLTARGTPGVVAESIGVRMRHHDGRGAVAVWVRPVGTAAWKFEAAFVAALRRVGASELAKYIEGES